MTTSSSNMLSIHSTLPSSWLRTTPSSLARPPPSPTKRKLWTLAALLTALPLLPVWIVKYLLRRPAGFASLATYVTARVIRHIQTTVPVLPVPDSGEVERAIPPPFPQHKKWRGGIDVQVVTVQPVPVEMRTAYAECPPAVQAVQRPMFILNPSGPSRTGGKKAGEGEKAIIYLVGGGYMYGHPLKSSFIWRNVRDTKLRAFVPFYRKCVLPSTSFPAPLLDALAAWEHVLSLSFAPENIVVMGDSAGGHLALALVTQLRALGREAPGALALCSPTVDVTYAFSPEARSAGPDDYLSASSSARGVHTYAQWYTSEALAGPLFSPALHEQTYSYKGRVLVSFGGREMLATPIRRFVEKLQAAGVWVEVVEETDGVHCGPVTTFGGESAYDAWMNGVQVLLA